MFKGPPVRPDVAQAHDPALVAQHQELDLRRRRRSPAGREESPDDADDAIDEGEEHRPPRVGALTLPDHRRPRRVGFAYPTSTGGAGGAAPALPTEARLPVPSRRAVAAPHCIRHHDSAALLGLD